MKFMKTAEPLFEDYGFEIIKCVSIAQALEAVNNKDSNFLLLDVDFPNSKKEGLIFLEQLRKMHPQLNVVVFTGYSDSDDAVTAIRDFYAFDYIQKPILHTKKRKLIFLKSLKSPSIYHH